MRARSPFPAPASAPFPLPDDLRGAEPAPANRAARRGRASGTVGRGAARTGSAGRARAAQGRRVNPVRRTG
jgi:hypothetical protein